MQDMGELRDGRERERVHFMLLPDWLVALAVIAISVIIAGI
jgi:hypothetical protein